MSASIQVKVYCSAQGCLASCLEEVHFTLSKGDKIVLGDTPIPTGWGRYPNRDVASVESSSEVSVWCPEHSADWSRRA